MAFLVGLSKPALSKPAGQSSQSISSTFNDYIWGNRRWEDQIGVADKVAKGVIVAGEAVEYFGSENVALTGHKVVNAGKDFRLNAGLFLIIRSIRMIPGVYNSLCLGFRIIKHILWNSSEPLILKKDSNSTDDSLPKKASIKNNISGAAEQYLALAATGGEIVAATTFMSSFGFCRPMTWFEKKIGPISPSKHAFSMLFPKIICVNHVATLIKSITGIIWAKLSYERQKDNCTISDDLYKEYYGIVDKNVVNVLDKSLDTALDVCKFGHGTPELKLVLSGAVAGIGLWKVLREVKADSTK